MTESDPPAERRLHPRHRALLAGRVAFGEPMINVACIIRSLSEGGATIELDGPTLLNGKLQLLPITEGVAYDVEVVWNKGLRVGLKFVGKHDLHGERAEEARYLQTIWKQTAAR